MTDQRFPSSLHIRRREDFRRIYARRKIASDDRLVVYGCENDVRVTRLAVVASRKVGNAVVRNRWKRRVREAFRLSRPHLPVGFDLIVLPRPGEPPALSEIVRSLELLSERAYRLCQRPRTR